MEYQIKPTYPEIPPLEEYVSEIKSIFVSGIMTNNGPKVQEFKKLLMERMDCQNLELFVNGHLALVLGINAIGLPENGEVLTSPFTFASTTNAIVQNRLVPVFCDIDDTYNLSLESLERNITKKTCAIITPHIFGIPCHVGGIEKLAEQYGLKVIYDAAQAFGTKVAGTDIANFGDAVMFSLHAIKVFNSIEGGILCFRDGNITRTLVENRNFGLCMEDKEDAKLAGINAKMDEFRAAMGIVNLNHLDEVVSKRRELARYYIEKLAAIPGVSTYPYEKEISYNYAYFPIRISSGRHGLSRDSLHKALEDAGVGSRKLYSRLTCDFKVYRDAGFRCDVQHARMVSGECLDLPLYSSLKREEIDYIVEVIGKWQREGGVW